MANLEQYYSTLIDFNRMMEKGKIGPMAYIIFRQDEDTIYHKLDPKKTITMGRSPSCDICFTGNKRLSRRHCEIFFCETRGRFILRDLKSMNGTSLNYRVIHDDKILAHSDIIHIGEVKLNFVEELEEVTDTTIAMKVAKPIKSYNDLEKVKPETGHEKTDVYKYLPEPKKKDFNFRLLKLDEESDHLDKTRRRSGQNAM